MPVRANGALNLNLLSATLALALTACGGGGSVVREDPPPTTPPVVSPSTSQPAIDAHLALTDTSVAHAAGYTGQGVRIGVVDSGVSRNHPALSGRVVANFNYIDGSVNNLSVDDVVGHGTYVAQVIAGKPVGSWPGGIAPDAQIVSARIISDVTPDDDGSGNGNEVDSALGLAPIHQDLINSGVKIMNNSWGGLYWTDPNVTDVIANEYRLFVSGGGNGGLVVFAAGNESNADPSDMAALPSQLGPGGSRPAADLERGWLTVAALDTNNPTQLASYSNACGVAMNYCLVAPGDVIVTGANDTVGGATTYYVVKGTSFAAPQVSGAAALVWEAFPYFDNDLVRQTLLGTAQDLGTPGVDSTFGYGLLDVGKAVKGPAQFNWGDVTVTFDGYTSTWSNAISGSGGLVKHGSGTLIIDAPSSYTGSTYVYDGTLRVNGGLNATHDVQIARNGTLELHNQAGIGSSVYNSGTLALYGNQVHRVEGGYSSQDSFARLAIEIGTRLDIGGDATLNNGILHVLGKATGYISNGDYVFLHADNGITGTFGSITTAPGVFLTATPGYNANDAWLSITQLNVTQVAQTFGNISAASLASASRVEDAFRQIDAQQGGATAGISADFIQAAGQIQGTPTAAAAEASLRSLSGELHAAAASMTFDTIDMNRRALSSRFAGLSRQPRLGGSWMQRLGGAGQGSYAGTDFDVNGWMLGSDYRVGARGVAGFAFGETRASSQLSATPDRGRDRQTQGQFYMGSLHGDGYTLGQLGFGRYERRMDRRLLLGQDYRGVSTDYAGDFVAASVEAGYRLGNGLTPYVGADYTRIRNGGFSEQGADGFGLMTGDSVSSRSQAVVGLRLGRVWRGMDFHGYGEWQQALSSSGLDVQARFVGADAWSPLLDTQPARSGGLFGVGVDAWLSRSTRLSLGYDQRFGPRGDDRNLSVQVVTDF